MACGMWWKEKERKDNKESKMKRKGQTGRGWGEEGREEGKRE